MDVSLFFPLLLRFLSKSHQSIMFSLQIKACKCSAEREGNSWREDTAPFLLSALGIYNKLKMKFLSLVIYQAQDLTKDKQMLQRKNTSS